MLIELWRRVVASDYTQTTCAVCGNDFDRGSVFPVAFTDNGYELGEMCLGCLDYLNRCKRDAYDPTLDNWPARDWPSLEILQASRRCYPEPMYADHAALSAAGVDWEAEDGIYAASVVWEQRRERANK